MASRVVGADGQSAQAEQDVTLNAQAFHVSDSSPMVRRCCRNSGSVAASVAPVFCPVRHTAGEVLRRDTHRKSVGAHAPDRPYRTGIQQPKLTAAKVIAESSRPARQAPQSAVCTDRQHGPLRGPTALTTGVPGRRVVEITSSTASAGPTRRGRPAVRSSGDFTTGTTRSALGFLVASVPFARSPSLGQSARQRAVLAERRLGGRQFPVGALPLPDPGNRPELPTGASLVGFGCV